MHVIRHEDIGVYRTSETIARVMEDLAIAVEIVHGVERGCAIVSALNEMQRDAGENQSMPALHIHRDGRIGPHVASRVGLGGCVGDVYGVILTRRTADAASIGDWPNHFVAESAL